ncbi:MAG: hypothetical protein WBG24_19210, partial [Syntrophobacteria bacterium]
SNSGHLALGSRLLRSGAFPYGLFHLAWIFHENALASAFPVATRPELKDPKNGSGRIILSDLCRRLGVNHFHSVFQIKKTNGWF